MFRIPGQQQQQTSYLIRTLLFVAVVVCLIKATDATPTTSIPHGGTALLTMRHGTGYKIADKQFLGVSASFSPKLPAPSPPVRQRIVVADPINACAPLENTHSHIQDAWVLINRGTCSFAEKVLRAQSAGARGVLIANTDESLFVMSRGATGEGSRGGGGGGKGGSNRGGGGGSANAGANGGNTGAIIGSGIKDTVITIPALLIPHNAAEELRISASGSGIAPISIPPSLFIERFSPPLWDPSVLVLFTIAMFLVLGGAYYSSVRERKLYLSTITQQSGDNEPVLRYQYGVRPSILYMDTGYGGDNDDEEEEGEVDEEGGEAGSRREGASERDGQGNAATNLDITGAIGFITMASVMLLVLFFFLDELVYIVIAVFMLGGTQSLYSVSMTLMKAIGFRRLMHISMDLPAVCRHYRVKILPTFLLAFCSLVTVVWCMYRLYPNAWMLQNVICAALLLTIQRTLRFPNIKVATFFLLLAFVYDVFWVFISPFFFSSSVMVEVATGGNTGESLPMLLRVPRFRYTEMMSSLPSSLTSYAILGLGDVALPGLLASHLVRVDYVMGKPWSMSGYFLPVFCGYFVGLGLTDIALLLTHTGQPALLYIVPCMLVTLLSVAIARDQLGMLWSDDLQTIAAAYSSSSSSPKPSGDSNARSSSNSDKEASLTELGTTYGSTASRFPSSSYSSSSASSSSSSSQGVNGTQRASQEQGYYASQLGSAAVAAAAADDEYYGTVDEYRNGGSSFGKAMGRSNQQHRSNERERGVRGTNGVEAIPLMSMSSFSSSSSSSAPASSRVQNR